MLRSLADSFKLNLAVALAAAVSTAVLVGALLVGASLESSLKGLATERLGRIDHVLVATSFLSEDLADRLAASPTWQGDAPELAPFLALVGSAQHPESQQRSSSVSIWGVDQRLAEFFEHSELRLDRSEGQFFPSVVVNEALARELGAQKGDAVLLSFQSASAAPSESLIANKETVETLRAIVSDILPDRDLGRFGLAPTQQLVHNAFVELGDLQAKLGRQGRVNAIAAVAPDRTADQLTEAIQDTWSFKDLGLTSKFIPSGLSIESEEFVLRNVFEEAIVSAAEQLEVPSQSVLTYLANRISLGERTLPYSTVAAMDLPPKPAFGDWSEVQGSTQGTEGLVLNTWAAQDLAAKVGDSVSLAYFEVGPKGDLVEVERDFTISAIVATEGLAADSTLTPDFPGIADADSISDWDPPFPVDLGLIGARDEDYWDIYRGTPKAYVGLLEGQALWTSRFGELTSIRIGLGPNLDAGGSPRRRSQDAPPPEHFQQVARDLEAKTLSVLSPASTGLSFEAVRERSLSGSGGSTDFPGLFLAFSFFLILSAALLVALLFRLSIQQKASQLGLRLALGFPMAKVRNLLAAEGLALAALGGLLGLGLGIAYASWLLSLLKGLWKPLLESAFLELAIPPGPLLGGLIASSFIVLLVMLFELRRLRRIAIPQLLHGEVDSQTKTRQGRRVPLAGLLFLLIAIALAGTALASKGEQNSSLFFALGTSLLISGFAFFSWWCRRPQTATLRQPFALWGLATRNSSRNTTRSLLSVILVGVASFILVSVGANRHAPDPRASEILSSGTGGYTLVAQSEIPIARDLSNPDTLFDLGFSEEQSAQVLSTGPRQLRLLDGDDASCLNLYRPERPRVLGVPKGFIERGGFSFTSQSEVTEAPWDLLHQTFDDGAIPAIGDFNSVKWILQSSLGEEVLVPREDGDPVRLRLVGLLDRSLFQSELIVSEEHFLKAFPEQEGFSYFLFEGPFEQTPALAQALEENLSQLGLDATRTADKLAEFEAVEGMYISTFQVLGGLGLLLGTLGLGLVLVRNVIERQGELATLRAFGYSKSTLARMVLLENSFLLLIGMIVGGGAGFLAVLPNLIHASSEVPWSLLAATLLGVFATGLVASVFGVLALLRTPLIPVLKSE